MDNSESLDWTHEVDVLVIGGGGGGMAAAVAAAEESPEAEVLVLQKIGSLGGSTTMAMGNFTAAETSVQAEHGIEDDAALHFDDMSKLVDKFQEGAGRYFFLDFEGDLEAKDNLDLRRLHTENAGATLDWLRDLGCEYAGPYRDPPHCIPRTYQIQPDTGAYATVLGSVMDDLGVETRFETEAYELVQDDADRVIGALARQRDRSNPALVRARRGVVLACGDYVNSPELREEHTSNLPVPPINEHNSGDGHEMALDAGAAVRNMDVQWILLRLGDPTYIVPEIPELVNEGAILVNGDGERYVNERSDYDQLVKTTHRQPAEAGYLLFDEGIASKFTEWPHFISTFGKEGKVWAFLDEYLGTDYGHRAETVAELADRLGVDPATLEGTVTDYNDGVHDPATDRRVDRFGREERGAIEAPPFYGIGPIRPYLTIADGGVLVSRRMAVLEEDGAAIDGLYAAGVMAGDHHLFGHGHHHSWIFTSGRIAGRSAARAD